MLKVKSVRGNKNNNNLIPSAVKETAEEMYICASNFTVLLPTEPLSES